MPQAYRYALYLAPTGPWRRIGSHWLGRCEETGAMLPRAEDDDPRLDSWTQAPRHYGLHATLKPPFRLRAGTGAAALDTAVRTLARTSAPFGAPLERRMLRGFLAWCLAPDDAARAGMHALADQAVRQLDPFRAPPSAAELARRQTDRLSPAHQRMLALWGYPYAMETFTFHITLTGMLTDAELALADAMLQARSGQALTEPMPVRAVSVYVQPLPDAPFIVARHYNFDGSIRDCAGARYMDEAVEEAA